MFGFFLYIRKIWRSLFTHLFRKIALITGGTFAAGIAGAEGTAAALRASAGIDDGLPLMTAGAAPPDFFAAAGEYVVGSKSAVLGWVPLFGDGRIARGQIVEAGKHSFVGAVGTAAVALGATGDYGLILVPLIAAPPDFAIAGGSDVVRRQRSVFRRMPLASDVGILAGQVIFAGDDLFACADWATAAAAAAGDGCLIGVAFGTDPPDFAPTAGDNVGWGEGAVFGWMPLSGELGIEAGEIVLAGLDELIGANGTAGAVDTRFYLCPPFVAVVTLPPHESMAAGQDIGWGEGGIFGWVPLTSEIWIGCGEVVHAGQRQSSAAIWAACAAAGAGVDGGLPVVTVGTGPPDFAFAAVADAVGSEWRVARAVPLGEKILALVAMAIF